ncbi:hypothetical protein DL89DRAFT_323867 [Linderina pennispora]|uniref:ER membrane protein complex subunit 7 beta-sandwich domain-containing protein n=1 Tax=Linderina pennispora TaxID=61395 RepID=A0A1Y1W4L2_9FUNG|nr:uncharacterized protein DL89DRAFT_323867 [Linderina pennispora]ORX68328.1 hypothetical protein DL89DRAFT_323867 [Linderina pennispora]
MRFFNSLVLLVQRYGTHLCDWDTSTKTRLGLEKTYRVRGTVLANDVLADVSGLATSARSDGTFAVDNVKLGDSMLEINSADYAFPKVHLRILLKEDGRASIAARYVQVGSEWSEDTPVLAYPLRIAAADKFDFFTPRQGFSLISMFSNPYMMMVGASLAAVFILPRPPGTAGP